MNLDLSDFQTHAFSLQHTAECLASGKDSKGGTQPVWGLFLFLTPNGDALRFRSILGSAPSHPISLSVYICWICLSFGFSPANSMSGKAQSENLFSLGSSHSCLKLSMV